MTVLPDMTSFDDPHAAAGAIVPRATAETIVRNRNTALELFGRAHAALSVADSALRAAYGSLAVLKARENRFNHHTTGKGLELMGVSDRQERDDFMRVARHRVDTLAWSHIVDITDLDRLMDKQAKDQLYQQLITDPPEVTVDNIYATLDQFARDAGNIFRRGIANVFSKLDRRFKSHDGFKIGSRIILTFAFESYSGRWSYGNSQRDAIIDIERVFKVLDGEKVSYDSIIDAVDRDRRRGPWGPKQSETVGTYFKVRGFKNGNAHLWFTRDDLVEKVNRLLAEYYGEVIGDGMQAEDDGGLFTPKTTPAKRYGFYPTPDEAADAVIKLVPLWREKDKPPLRVCEPSAGSGNLARRCFDVPMVPESDYDWRVKQAREHNERLRFDHQVDCIEIQPHLAESLRREGIYRRVYTADFLSLAPATTGLYDRIVMNPPFDRERDIDHVVHALGFLEPDGFLIAIMSAGTEFRETRKAIAFRALMEKMNAQYRDLPPGSFSSVGTNCNTIILTVYKDGRRFYPRG